VKSRTFPQEHRVPGAETFTAEDAGKDKAKKKEFVFAFPAYLCARCVLCGEEF
jgi:hypothetical protein